MSPPTLLNQYRHSRLQENFSQQIAAQFHLESPGVRITSSALVDLDNDGERDDLAGTALLQVGQRFKSFLFLLREDGATRFLENNGTAFDPNAGIQALRCVQSRPWHCPATLDRAARQISRPRFSVIEFTRNRPGLEIVIELGGGSRAMLNSLEVFSDSPR